MRCVSDELVFVCLLVVFFLVSVCRCVFGLSVCVCFLCPSSVMCVDIWPSILVFIYVFVLFMCSCVCVYGRCLPRPSCKQGGL